MTFRRFLFAVLMALVLLARAATQEQIDKADPNKSGPLVTKDMTLRVRIAKVAGDAKTFTLSWKRGGQGLGGLVYTGPISNADGGETFAIGEWSRPVPVDEVVGKGGWSFPNLIAAEVVAKKAKVSPLVGVVIEMEFADKGKAFKSFAESAPKGTTVTFTFNGAAGDRATFERELLPLSEYVKARKQRLEKIFDVNDPTPKLFAILGHHGGYGEGAGYAIRHNNPEIAADESRIQRLLGFNGMVGKKSLEMVDAAGLGSDFRRLYFGGPGAGSPMAFFKPKPGQEPDGCPFDPDLHASIAKGVQSALAEHKAAAAKESWAEWVDEIGVAAKEHIQNCPRCREKYEAYLRANGVKARDVGFAEGAVRPYPLWKAGEDAKKKPTLTLAPAPAGAEEALNYYYSYRFMTYATGQLFPEAAKSFKEQNIPLFAMQGPTPSWSGHSLDWHEFYDQKANTAAVWETSNRDPRTWQFESYLADIMRGIATRLQMLIGTLVKPHRGAPEQRLFTAVSRGASAIEWYTYGPDYARGDSFSQRPDLLERVGKANRLLAKAEPWLYGAKPLRPAEVAFVSPRSSEIWGRATELDVTAFENAKWVYLALRHAHIPVDILSEQQLAEGKLDQYKTIYVPGTHLRRDASEQLGRWIKASAERCLWTDALGLSRDEANQPTDRIAGLMVLDDRKHERWGKVERYGAVDLKPLVEMSPPELGSIIGRAGDKDVRRAALGRETLTANGATVLAAFGDGKTAAMNQRYPGKIMVVGWWAGLTYSARVRRPDYDMRTDFDPDLREWISMAAERAARPVVPAEPTVEAVALVKDGRRSVVLMNWAYKAVADAGRTTGALQPAIKLRVGLPAPELVGVGMTPDTGLGNVKTVRSLIHGDLRLEGEGRNRFVVLPRLDEVDVLVLD